MIYFFSASCLVNAENHFLRLLKFPRPLLKVLLLFSNILPQKLCLSVPFGWESLISDEINFNVVNNIIYWLCEGETSSMFSPTNSKGDASLIERNLQIFKKIAQKNDTNNCMRVSTVKFNASCLCSSQIIQSFMIKLAGVA